MRHEQIDLPPQVESVTAGRHFLCHVVEEWGLGELLDAVSLAASEIITNAVVHARTSFNVSVHVDVALVVAVADSGPALPLSGGTAGLPELDSESGRGLALVAAVSDGWGVREQEASKTVWFRLLLPHVA